MCRPTRQRYRGRPLRLGEMSDDDAQPLHRGSGGSTYTRKAHATREAPSVVRSGMTGPTGRPWGESQQWLSYPTNPHVRFDERGVETELWLSH
jgi:hypothetical protein